MIQAWIGVALLAGSWLLGLDYFYPASSWAWLATVAAAVVLLIRAAGHSRPAAGALAAALESSADDVGCGISDVLSGCRSSQTIALILLLPVVWYASWPYRAAPLLIVAGLAVRLLPLHRRWAGGWAFGSMAAGVILFAQALALALYADHTAGSHDLPRPFPDLLAGVATLLGIDATADGSSIVMHSMRQVHRLGATWELLLDPATFLFFIGGLTMFALWVCGEMPTGRRWAAWLRALRTLTLILLAWLPLRAGLMMALYLHRVLRSDPDRPLHAMNHFFSPWMLLLLLAVPVLLAWRFVRLAQVLKDESGDLPSPAGRGAGDEGCEEPSKALALTLSQREKGPGDAPPCPVLCPPSPISLPKAAGWIALAVALFTAAIYWDPVGARHDGRVMVVERHSAWEPTNRAYDTTRFGESSGYNYAAMYDYLAQYYAMSRLLEKDKLDEQTLSKCDVLLIKIPTARYSQAEVEAVERFVQQGGGLLLIGDHTNFERSATAMNDITRRMGFIFRDDLLFGFNESPYDQLYVPPTLPHPAVQHIPPMDFAVSCSIDPGRSHGRAVVANTGLWSMGPEYHHENFHPIPQHCPEMRYGPFVQVWAARHGQGRAIAFADSTVFSNFCLFQPGKAEIMLGMVEWLNHANPLLDPRPWLLLLGLPPLVIGLWMTRQRSGVWLVLLAAGACGWVLASVAIGAGHRWALPAPEALRPERRIVIDRTTSVAPLARGMYPEGGDQGYGMLEAWIPRLGCCTVRKEGPESFSGDARMVICPSRSATEDFRDGLTHYVANGGKLVVIDAPENVGSTANSLLGPFGLSIHHDRVWKGKLTISGRLPMLDVIGAKQVSGGQPIGKLDKLPVVATAKHGKGSVMVIGCGSLWNDKQMGELESEPGSGWMLDPDATVKARYEVLFALLRSFLDNKPLPTSPPKEKTAKAAQKKVEKREKKPDGGSVLKESGPVGP
jgi:hypothetical protein